MPDVILKIDEKCKENVVKANLSTQELTDRVEDRFELSIVFLFECGKVEGKKGKTQSRKVKVKGDGDTVAQDATVTLSVMSPVGVSVVVNPMSMAKVVSPDDDDPTKYRFDADITCDAPGSYTLEWTATISAAQNSDTSNDTLTDTTSVRCKMAEDHDA